MRAQCLHPTFTSAVCIRSSKFTFSPVSKDLMEFSWSLFVCYWNPSVDLTPGESKENYYCFVCFRVPCTGYLLSRVKRYRKWSMRLYSIYLEEIWDKSQDGSLSLGPLSLPVLDNRILLFETFVVIVCVNLSWALVLWIFIQRSTMWHSEVCSKRKCTGLLLPIASFFWGKFVEVDRICCSAKLIAIFSPMTIITCGL